MPTDYLVKTIAYHQKGMKGRHAFAVVLVEEESKSKPRKASGEKLELFESDAEPWVFFLNPGSSGELKFSKKVDGEVRPFSIIVTESTSSGEVPVLKIRDRLFRHKNKMYVVSNVPEGRSIGDYQSGPKYISRLDGFLASDPSEIDPVTTSRAERRLRGVHVGEIIGSGNHGNGHRVRIEDEELEDIGLPLAVSSFLINTTAHSRLNARMSPAAQP